jgi:hypothetical protein
LPARHTKSQANPGSKKYTPAFCLASANSLLFPLAPLIFFKGFPSKKIRGTTDLRLQGWE